MKTRLIAGLVVCLAAPVLAQSSGPAHAAPVAPVQFGDSTGRRSWASEGAVVGGVAGALGMGGAFYHFTHRTGAPNSALSDLGGAFVGAVVGAASGALLGAFVGSLVPKHKQANAHFGMWNAKLQEGRPD